MISRIGTCSLIALVMFPISFCNPEPEVETPDLPPPPGPQLVNLLPEDGETDIALDIEIFFRFNQSAQDDTVTTHVGTTACEGSVHLSSDDFSTCVPMSSQPQVVNDFTYKIVTAENLLPETTYRLRVTTDVIGLSGEPKTTEFLMEQGFTTESDPT